MRLEASSLDVVDTTEDLVSQKKFAYILGVLLLNKNCVDRFTFIVQSDEANSKYEITSIELIF